MAQINPMLGTPSWNPVAAGARRYGTAGTPAATRGPVNQAGYQLRERENAKKRQIYLRWMQDNMTGQNGSANALRMGR